MGNHRAHTAPPTVHCPDPAQGELSAGPGPDTRRTRDSATEDLSRLSPVPGKPQPHDANHRSSPHSGEAKLKRLHRSNSARAVTGRLGEIQVVLTLAIVISQMETSEILQSSHRKRVAHPLCVVAGFSVTTQERLPGFHDRVTKRAAALG